MPLSDKRSFVARSTEYVRDVWRSRVRAGERIVQRSHGVDVRVLSGQDDRSAGRADGIRDEALVEPHALTADPVDIRCWSDLCQPPAVGADRVAGMIVRHDEQDVRTSF